MNLYTIIFEYREGTYISQVKAKDESNALGKWGESLDCDSIAFMGEKLKTKLNEQIAEELLDSPPVLLDGTKNVWCAGLLLFGLVNIIKTDEMEENNE